MSKPETNKLSQLSNREKVFIIGALNALLRNARNCGGGKELWLCANGRIKRRRIVLSLLHRWSQHTKASASFLLCTLLFLSLFLSFPFSFIYAFLSKLSLFCIRQLSTQLLETSETFFTV